MRKILGWAIMAIATLHFVVFFLFYGQPLSEIVQAGVWNTIKAPHWNRSAAFWFVYFAPFLFVLGMLLAWLAQKSLPWPRFLGWTLLGICIIGLIPLPASGIWLLVPISLLLVKHAGVKS